MPPIPQPAPLSRLHGLDTLRAAAILAVMIFHLQSRLPGALGPVESVGWTGVDLFFALSGFLIGSQLLLPVARGQGLNLPEFYKRRAYRILPAYLTVLALYVLVPGWRESAALPAVGKFLSFTANLLLRYPGERAFSQAWSLCVEEHFYLLLPVLVFALARRRSARLTVAVLVAVMLAGVAWRAWVALHLLRAPGLDDDAANVVMMKRIYYPTYARLDGLVAGVALALVRAFRPGWWQRLERQGWALLLAGVAASGAGLWLFGWEYPSPDRAVGLVLGFPVLSAGFGLLVASAAGMTGPLRHRVPGAQELAVLAFSLYLTHKEVAHALAAHVPWLEGNTGWVAAAVYAAACLGTAALLYIAVERPFLRLRERRALTARQAVVVARLDPAL